MPLIDEVRSFRQRVAERLNELEPLVREYNELKRVAAEIGLGDAAGDTAAEPGEDGGRSGGVADRVLDAVRADPGKTVADYAAILGVPATTLYRPVRELTTDGVLVKRARHLFPA